MYSEDLVRRQHSDEISLRFFSTENFFVKPSFLKKFSVEKSVLCTIPSSFVDVAQLVRARDS